MKNRILNVLLVVVLLFSLTGCGTTYQEATEATENKLSGSFGNGYFTTITEWDDVNFNYRIIYANDTKVKYFMVNSRYKFGITPLYNADGTLQIYEENED